MSSKLAVLAGRGHLPETVIERAQAEGRDVFVLAFEGETDPALVSGRPHAWVRLGAVGHAIRLLHQAAVDDVVMIGSIRRPSFANMQIDFRGMQVLAKLGLKARQGDNHLLETIARELESEGFRVIGADELLTSNVADEGVMTRVAPDKSASRDIALAVDVAMRLGELDIGSGGCRAAGNSFGRRKPLRARMPCLDRVAGLRRAGPGGVLVKMKKPDQDRRADLPTIGEKTIERGDCLGTAGYSRPCRSLPDGRPRAIDRRG